MEARDVLQDREKMVVCGSVTSHWTLHVTRCQVLFSLDNVTTVH